MPTMLITFLPILINVAMAALQSAGVTSPATTALANSLEQTVLPLVTKLQSGGGTSQDVLAVMGATVGVLQILKSQTGLSPEVLSQVQGYLTATEAGIAAVLQAEKKVDPTTLTQLQPVA